MSKKPVEYTDSEFDFGFTTVSEVDLKTRENQVAKQVAQQVTESSQAKVQRMYDMILPLLMNLKKDADKNEYIFWPDRAKKIDEFIAILTKEIS